MRRLIAWPVGVAALVSTALYKWHKANQVLEAAGLPWRVPVEDAVKHALNMPVKDLLDLGTRRALGCGYLFPPAE